MSVGIIMLVHTAFVRAEQVARHWATRDCPVVIHVDKRVQFKQFRKFRESLSDLPNVRFSARVRVEWGRWSLVHATQIAAQKMLDDFADVRHVYLASGSCVPLRPVEELQAYLAARPRTDFIESVTTREVDWAVNGLEKERFSLRFPFSWKRQRFMFDAYVWLQRLVRFKRKVPLGLEPHLGSQWWCLTRQTLSAILGDPDRRKIDKWFSLVWIPDEAYFQTLVRRYSTNIESRSLTLSKFDNQGKPHIFYDDHLQLLRRSDCFVARKIWPQATVLYDTFLTKPGAEPPRLAEPNPGKIDRVFAKALERRTKGRAGLYMQSRFPKWDWENGKTSARYNVFCGFDDLFQDFEPWLEKRIGGRVHGHLFHPERAQFAGRDAVFQGCISDSAALRDYRSKQFLTNLIWATRGETQSFMFGPGDTQKTTDLMLYDPNAHIALITGAWAVPLFHSNRNFDQIRTEAARLQAVERTFAEQAQTVHVKAKVQIWTLADFIDAPMEHLQDVLDQVSGPSPRLLTEAPRMRDLKGFGQFLQNLRNQGMKPTMMGDFQVSNDPTSTAPDGVRPYVVK
jgi:hypothetical protein